MTILNHILGFPRIGCNRELKQAQEKYWNNLISQKELLSVGYNIRKYNWRKQIEEKINFLTVGDFAWYDHVLNTSMLLGNIPERHKNIDKSVDLDTLFRIARGHAPTGQSVAASDMTKWFDTNYHYIVPEFFENQNFSLNWIQLFQEIDEALLLNHTIKPVILGPLTYLWLGKSKNNSFNKLDLLNSILPVYKKILKEISKRNITWIQIDEPILALELPTEWKKSFILTYNYLYSSIKILLTTYFDSINHNLDIITQLPIQGLHVDVIFGQYNLSKLNKIIPIDWVLSLGVINGRNIWRTDLIKWFQLIQPITNMRTNLWISTSCSLLHVPVDLNIEKNLNDEIKSWFAFAIQKCTELNLLTDALNNNDTYKINEWSKPIHTRKNSNLVHKINVQDKLNSITEQNFHRKNKYSIRSQIQNKKFNFPILPTTTIGSFPQTVEIRKLRLDFKEKNITKEKYNQKISNYIKDIIHEQEKINLDVLVHGEPERNDMVEYFSKKLNGFISTSHGWVQSYGSRCVKPPIIIGDISRSEDMTVKWSRYAQSLTKKPVKGMLTGPVTMLCWSFSREDLSKKNIANQIALALRDEVHSLEKSGIQIIQIDEPALREGLPLRKSLWDNYLLWATNAFKLASSGVNDETQIHTHMCYCEFNDIMNSILLLDADVITLETSRSDMELLEFFKEFNYVNSIGPGVYDIHSPNIPTVEWIENLLKKALNYISLDRLWVNPDCGLKTRNWKETRKALKNMITAVKNIRSKMNSI
ncbi:5-methyltetrahydropteroyltriglutamate--homocysteine methyltransferase [Buchnera aphidicola (Eriosoma grossulariae)]|uniref:5-methyltetrahydropteroyltriglutamate-- homocysteine S-methyltransferase n=1 Tax=Buchnera aphidicola TaxID=9 RepID=UPI003464CF89